MMTHPTRTVSVPTLAEAVAAISDEDMTRMCLSVNMALGSEAANRLLHLIAAARKEAGK